MQHHLTEGVWCSFPNGDTGICFCGWNDPHPWSVTFSLSHSTKALMCPEAFHGEFWAAAGGGKMKKLCSMDKNPSVYRNTPLGPSL